MAPTTPTLHLLCGKVASGKSSLAATLAAPPDAVCLVRLRARNTQGDHAFAATEEQFHRFARHFVAPTPDEGFTIVRY